VREGFGRNPLCACVVMPYRVRENLFIGNIGDAAEILQNGSTEITHILSVLKTSVSLPQENANKRMGHGEKETERERGSRRERDRERERGSGSRRGSGDHGWVTARPNAGHGVTQRGSRRDPTLGHVVTQTGSPVTQWV
jgi:hypothetical protein